MVMLYLQGVGESLRHTLLSYLHPFVNVLSFTPTAMNMLPGLRGSPGNIASMHVYLSSGDFVRLA